VALDVSIPSIQDSGDPDTERTPGPAETEKNVVPPGEQRLDDIE
jgi:hypothetical protein